MIFILMIAGVAGMLVGLKRRKEGAPGALALTLLGVGLTVMMTVFNFCQQRSPRSGALDDTRRAEQYQAIIGERVGRWLASEYPDAEVLVIEGKPSPTPYMRGLTRGINEPARLQVGILDFEHVRLDAMRAHGLTEEDFDAMAAGTVPDIMPMDIVPPEFFINALDQLIQQSQPRPDLVVMLVPLPEHYNQLAVWRQPSRPNAVLVDGIDHPAGGADLILEEMARGRVVAAVVLRAELPHLPSRPPFDEPFLLITRDNLAEFQKP